MLRPADPLVSLPGPVDLVKQQEEVRSDEDGRPAAGHVCDQLVICFSSFGAVIAASVDVDEVGRRTGTVHEARAGGPAGRDGVGSLGRYKYVRCRLQVGRTSKIWVGE